MHQRLALCSTAFLAHALVAPGSASAAATESAQDLRQAHLNYDRTTAPSCPTEESFRNAVAGRLGYDPFVESAATSITVVFQRRPNGQLRANVQVVANGTPAGNRSLETSGDDCAEVGAAMAIAVSIAIDPMSLSRGAPAVSAPAPVSPAPVALPEVPPMQRNPSVPVPLEDRRSVDRKSVNERPSTYVGLGGSVAALAQPLVALGPALEIGVRYRSLSAALAVRSEFAVASSRLGSADVSTFAAEGDVLACGHVDHIALCGDFGAGAFRASTSSGLGTTSAIAPYILLGPRFAYDLPLLARVSVRFSVDVRVALVSARIHFDGGEVWRSPSPIVPSGGLAILVQLP